MKAQYYLEIIISICYNLCETSSAKITPLLKISNIFFVSCPPSV
jgi:hypothetical protein